MKTILVTVKMILIIVITVSIGSVLGAIGYVASIKNNPPVAVRPTPTITQIITPTATPTLTPTITPNIDISDWKTYRNENFGYEIRYPKDWELIYLSKTIPGNTGVVLKSPTYQPIKDGNVTHEGEIYISNMNNPNNLSIKDLFATFNDYSVFRFKEFDYKNITINGNLGVLFDSITENKITSIEAYIRGEKKVIGITYLFLENPNREIYDKILSTFKFTEIDNTADWKTYKNEKYRFELIFPSSWKGYIVKTKELELVGTERYDSINFGFNIQNSLFNINIFTKDQWNKLVSSEVGIGRPEPNYINKNEKFFFNVIAAQYTENQEMADRMSEISNILSTFKFIKTDDTADWKIYRNVTYGFEFKYPSNWISDGIEFDLSKLENDNIFKATGTMLEISFSKKDLQGQTFVLSIMDKTIDEAISFDQSVFGKRTGNSVIIGDIMGEKLEGTFYGMQYIEKDKKIYFFRQINASDINDQKDYDMVIRTFKFIK